jgi:hypothetical protein
MNVREKLTLALAVLGVIRELEATNETMTYGQLCKAVGLGEWERSHRFKISEVLNILDAVDYGINGPRTIDWNRFVTQADGEPGAGMYRQNRIVRDPPMEGEREAS